MSDPSPDYSPAFSSIQLECLSANIPSGQIEDTPDFEFEIPKPGSGLPDTRPKPPPSRPPPTNQPQPVLSFSTDPNPSSTEQCTTAHVSSDGVSKPLVQWALMIDAGSTGSRIHVYKFNNCLSSPTFEYEVFQMTRPGLSSFANNAQKAAESLDPLMKEAENTVPRSLWKCTPVAVKATAGLRLLGHAESDAILAAVKQRLQTNYEFPLVSKDGVVIMDGKDEGVYAWITANYLLNTLPSGPATTNSNVDPSNSTPYAVLDLGGASTQIVFKPSFDADGDGIDDDGKGLEDGEHKYDLYFGGQTHVLYQHSYLGYGLMRARAGVHRVVEFMGSYASSTSSSHGDEDDSEEEIANPCITRGMTKRVEVDIGRAGTKILRNVTMTGADIGSWNACNRVLELVMAKDA
jgi:guanosine-diphosphatase